MLGVGSGSSKSGKIKRIVKDGLQAWYKADKTQAPLGEEEIANGKFAIGPDLVGGDLPTFFDDTTYFSHANGLVTISSEAGVSAENNEGFLEHSKTYKVTVDVVTLAGSNPRVYLGGVNSDALVEGVNIKYVTTDGSSDHVGFNSAQGTVFRSYTVERTNPNDSWTLGSNWSMQDGVLTSDASANAQALQDMLTIGKKYRITYTIASRTSGTMRCNAGSTLGTGRSAVGTFTEDLICAGDTRFDLDSNATFVGTVTNCTVKEITNSIKDFSPNVNNGVLYSGKCLDFDGNGDYVTIADDDSLDVGTGDFTLAAWVYCDTVATAQVMLSKLNGTAGYELYKGTDDGGNRILLEIDDGSGVKQSYDFGASSGLTGSAWHRIVVVADRDSDARLYMNGELISTVITSTAGETWSTFSSDSLDNTADFTIGAKSLDQTLPWFGMIADVQLYKKAWTASDVTYDYNNPDKDVFDDEGRAEVVSDIELVTHGAFDDTGSWSGARSISGGQLTKTGGGLAYQDGVVTAGKTYQVTVDVETVGAANQIYAGGNNSSNLVAGVQTVYIVAGPTNAYIGFNNGDTSTVYNSISVKEVTTQAGEISPTDCTALYRLNEGAGDRVYNAAPVLGAELIVNGDFTIAAGSTGDGWTTVGNASITNGEGVLSTSGDRLKQTVLTSGKLYKYSFKAKSVGASGYNLKIDSPLNGTKVAISDVPETYTDYSGFLKAGSADIIFKESGTPGVTIDDVSVKEVSLSNSYALVGDPAWTATAQPYIPQYAMSSYSKKMIFDGTDDVISCGSDSSIDDIFNGGGSWSVWISAETRGEGGAGYIISKGSLHLRTSNGSGSNDSGSDVTVLFYQPFSGSGVNTRWSIPATDVLKNKINHLVVTYNSSGVSNDPKIYVNGVRVPFASVTEVITPSGTADSDAGNDFTIGSKNTSGDNAFDGFIDEVSVWDKELSAAEVQEIFNSGIALDCRDHSAASDLQAYWRNNGTNQWDDLSDNSNHGTVNGSPTTIQLQEVPFFKKDTFGLPMNMVRERGLIFDGDGYLKVDDDNSLDITSNGTWEFWLKIPPQGMSADQFLLDKQGSYSVKVQNNETVIFGSTQSSGVRSSGYNTPLVVDKWYHVAITFDSSTTSGFTFYIDGESVPISQGSGNMPAEPLIATANPLHIGTQNDLTNDFVDGKLDDIKIYNRVLSADEVKKNYRATKSKHTSTSNWSDDFSSSFI